MNFAPPQVKFERGVVASYLKPRHREAHWSILTAVAIQGAIMLSGILVARILGPENRGHLAFIALAPLILSQLGSLGVPLALTYYTARSPESQAVLVRRAARVLVPSLAACLIAHLVIVLAFASSDGNGVLTAALFTILATAGWSAQIAGLAILQGRQRFGVFNILRTLQVSLYAASTVGLLVFDVRDLAVVAAVWSLTFIASGSTALMIALRSSAPFASSTGDVPSIGSMLRFGLKSLPAQVSPVESFRIDQLFLGLLAGPTILGYYVAAAALTNLPRVIATNIGMVAYPRVAAARSDQAKLTLRYVVATAAVCGAIVVGLEALCSFLIPLFFGAEFEAAVGIARILLLAALFMGLKRILNDCARGMGRPDLGLKAELVSWLPLIPGFLLVGTSGTGVAWSLAISAATGAAALTAMVLYSRRSVIEPTDQLIKVAELV